MGGGWTTAQIPDQTRRSVMAIGANSGLGLVTAHELASERLTAVPYEFRATGAAPAPELAPVTG